MLNTVIYNESGNIIMITSQTGYKKVFSIEVDIPEDQYIKSIDIETNKPIFEFIPKTKDQLRIDAIETQINAILGIESEWFIWPKKKRLNYVKV